MDNSGVNPKILEFANTLLAPNEKLLANQVIFPEYVSFATSIRAIFIVKKLLSKNYNLIREFKYEDIDSISYIDDKNLIIKIKLSNGKTFEEKVVVSEKNKEYIDTIVNFNMDKVVKVEEIEKNGMEENPRNYKEIREALSNALLEEEALIDSLEFYESALFLTDRRIIIVRISKAGLLSTSKVKGIAYESITSVELSKGPLLYTLQLTIPGSSEEKKSGILGTKSENAISFADLQLDKAKSVLREIEQRIKLAKQSSSNNEAVSLTGELEKLFELFKLGVLNEEEFQKAKIRLLDK